MTKTIDDKEAKRHRAKMAKRKEVQDKEGGISQTFWSDVCSKFSAKFQTNSSEVLFYFI